MPTGYTYKIEEGCTFNEFILGCARAFGALVNMRDDAQDAEMPDEIKPGTYHSEQIVTCEGGMLAIKTMSIPQLEVKIKERYDSEVASRDEYLADQKKHKEQYAAMLDHVKAWEPPTADHVGLKDFMINQINLSMSRDYIPTPPVLLPVNKWVVNEMSRLAKDLEYNRKEHAEEVDRCKGRTQWIKSLRASLTEE